MSVSPSPLPGRLLIATAAVLWSLSGAFTKLLTHPTASLPSLLGLNDPPVASLQIAFYRVLFAGIVFLPLLRFRDLAFRPPMAAMIACFASMNFLFVSAMAEGKAANAILLQYTAPIWMFLMSLWILREPAERSSLVALVLSLLGIAIIVWDGWQQLGVVAMGLGSGVTYAGVVICLRVLRTSSAAWLTILNHLCGALILLPWVWNTPVPTLAQLGFLFLFGAVQMGLPYWLMARGLRTVGATEAGLITLLEPILNPLWAYLVVGETPSVFTWIGGSLILGALAWRYRPGRARPEAREAATR